MNLELSRREQAITVVVSAALLAIVIASGVGMYKAQRTLHQEADLLRSRLGTSSGELAAVTQDRDASAERLRPFTALADRQFASEPAERRLTLLQGRIDDIVHAMMQSRGRRHLSPEAAGRIRAKIVAAPSLDVEVGGISSDPEALALADELKVVLESAGLKTRQVAQYMPAVDLPTGVSVYSRHQLDGVLGSAIAQIFVELNQPRVQWLEDDMELPDPATTAEPPDLKIIVGRR